MFTDFSYLKQISHIPLLTNHVIVSFTATNLRRFTVHENLFNDKSHSAEAISVSILPYCVVVDFMNTIDETYLENSLEFIVLLFLQCLIQRRRLPNTKLWFSC